MKDEKNHNSRTRSCNGYLFRILLKSKSWMQTKSLYGWLSLMLLCFVLMSYKDKNKKVRTLQITGVTKQGCFFNPVSDWRQLTIQDTVKILEKDSVKTYIFQCSGEKYAESIVIASKKIEVGDTVHIVK